MQLPEHYGSESQLIQAFKEVGGALSVKALHVCAYFLKQLPDH